MFRACKESSRVVCAFNWYPSNVFNWYPSDVFNWYPSNAFNWYPSDGIFPWLGFLNPFLSFMQKCFSKFDQMSFNPISFRNYAKRQQPKASSQPRADEFVSLGGGDGGTDRNETLRFQGWRLFGKQRSAKRHSHKN